MKASTVSTLKKELNTLPANELVDICLKLVKYKKENKELLSYLLFDANNEPEYIIGVKREIDQQFDGINFSHLYFAKKSIRKILKSTAKYIRYSGNKQTEAELLIYYLGKLKNTGIRVESSNSISNLFANQVKKIKFAIQSLHEDLQHDYNEELAILLKRR